MKSVKRGPKAAQKSVSGALGIATHSLLIEIGTEEIPANYLFYADRNHQEWFRQYWNQALEKINADGAMEWGETQIACTPRRLVIWMPAIRFNGTVKKQPVYGPPLDRAYDASGKPTPMLLGFLEAKKADLKSLGRFEVKGRVCVGFEESVRPQPLKSRLAEAVNLFARLLTYPKTMVWDSSGLRYPRPVRWVLCLLDGSRAVLDLGGIRADGFTAVFAHGKRKKVLVRTASQYFALLKKEGIVLSASDRREAIEKDLRELTRKAGGVYAAQTALLDEVVYLTERPAAFLGEFDPSFAQLPPEVLTSSLSKSQRLFSIQDKEGRHLPYYVMVLDGMPKDPSAILKTVSSILKAKLQDSRFFWSEDLKAFGAAGSGAATRLEGELAHLLYLKGAGSMAQKILRIRDIANESAAAWGVTDAEKSDLDEAARYCKVDLLTQMVGEFPELQGVMGGYYYALLAGAGARPSVSAAIREHYKPASAEDRPPVSRIGAALALLDKADLVVACFMLGKMPTASQDPYGLKRAAQGVFKCAATHRFAIRWNDLSQALLRKMTLAGFAAEGGQDKVLARLRDFYLERAASYFEQRGYAPALVRAVLSVNADDFLDAESRLEALSGLADSDSFVAAAKVFQRLTNILKSAPIDETNRPIDESHFEKPEEAVLYGTYQAKREVFAALVRKGDYREATTLYAEAFNAILHGFFEGVMVRVEDSSLRANRLSLLHRVRSLYSDSVADLSQIRPESATLLVSTKKS